jgi:hypothetical protein
LRRVGVLVLAIGLLSGCGGGGSTAAPTGIAVESLPGDGGYGPGASDDTVDLSCPFDAAQISAIAGGTWSLRSGDTCYFTSGDSHIEIDVSPAMGDADIFDALQPPGYTFEALGQGSYGWLGVGGTTAVAGVGVGPVDLIIYLENGADAAARKALLHQIVAAIPGVGG